jgi:hypothetical protein
MLQGSTGVSCKMCESVLGQVYSANSAAEEEAAGQGLESQH